MIDDDDDISPHGKDLVFFFFFTFGGFGKENCLLEGGASYFERDQ